eukprot:CFRG0901T1
MSTAEEAAFYDGHTDRKVELDLGDEPYSYMRVQFKRSLMSTTIRPALGHLSDGVNTLQDKINGILRTSTTISTSNTIAITPTDAKSDQEAATFVPGQTQLNVKPTEVYENLAEKSNSRKLPGSDLLDEAIHGIVLASIYAEPVFKASCSWFGQFLVNSSDDKQAGINIDMSMWTPEGTTQAKEALADGPGPALMGCTWDWCEAFQVSRVLRLSFDVNDVSNVWFQTNDDAAVLSLRLNGPIRAFTRRINCSIAAKNNWRERSDFSLKNSKATSSTGRILKFGGNSEQLKRFASLLVMLHPPIAEKILSGCPGSTHIEENVPGKSKKRQSISLNAASHALPPRCKRLPEDKARDGVHRDASDSENECVWNEITAKSENSLSEIMSLLIRSGFDPTKDTPRSWMEKEHV